ncbi:helix-turn-helix domain-containing protein [Mycobacteroides chelonae]|uniref:helix-turn-helix domain-containing protein n=1 Tax=Mycobacteroides chelonae TaxID=1774 RepID=UPI003AAF220F
MGIRPCEPARDKLAAAMKAIGHPIEEAVRIPLAALPSDWRVLAGFTQPQLAAAASMPTTTLQKIERGESLVSDERASILANS